MQVSDKTAVRSESIIVSKDDLVLAWTGLEKLIVPLHRIGSRYATSGPDVPLTQEQRNEMLEEIGRLLSYDLVEQLGSARVILGDYLPNDEAEAISDSLEFYQPTGPSTKTN